MTVEHEVVIEFNKMLVEHTGALWKIAGGLILIEILIIAHTLASQRVAFRRSGVAWLLSLSAIANAASLVFGYFANAAALTHFQDYAVGKDWTPSSVAEVLNLAQMIALTAAFVIFVIAFLGYSVTLADALTKIKKLPNGGGE
jgi:hypothetical protein